MGGIKRLFYSTIEGVAERTGEDQMILEQMLSEDTFTFIQKYGKHMTKEQLYYFKEPRVENYEE